MESWFPPGRAEDPPPDGDEPEGDELDATDPVGEILRTPEDFVPAAGPEAPEVLPMRCPTPVTREGAPVPATLKAP